MASVLGRSCYLEEADEEALAAWSEHRLGPMLRFIQSGAGERVAVFASPERAAMYEEALILLARDAKQWEAASG